MIRLAVIGAGNMARCHIETIVCMPNVWLAGIYSRTKSRAVNLANEFSVKFVASSVAELYHVTQADGVVVAVEETATEQIISEIALHNWSALVEKPIGLGLCDSKRICERSADTGLNLYVAMNRRHYASTQMAVQKLTQIGGRRIVQIHDQEDPSSALTNGRKAVVCDNWHFANSIHLIDLFDVFCRGEVSKVRNVIPWTTGYGAKSTHSIIEFDSGDVGIYTSVWNAPGPWLVAISTPTKRLEMRPVEYLSEQTYPSRQITPCELGDVDQKFKPGVFCQMNEFVKALNRKNNGSVDITSYLRSVKLTSQLYESD